MAGLVRFATILQQNLPCRALKDQAATRRNSQHGNRERERQNGERCKGNGEKPLIAFHAARLWHQADVDLTLGLEGAPIAQGANNARLHDCPEQTRA